jgi:hypothetical protein
VVPISDAFPVRVVGDEVELALPPAEVLDAALATERVRVRAGHGEMPSSA